MTLKQHDRSDVQDSSEPSSTKAIIYSLANISAVQVRGIWREQLKTEPPTVRSSDLLKRLLSWHLQAQEFGGLDSATDRILAKIGEALERDNSYQPKIRHDLSAGLVLTREWKGVFHKVIVTSDGFQHLGKRYRSLSDIARTITGTRWSGPRFFGLEQKSSPSSRRIEP